jgi:hypothetical protein
MSSASRLGMLFVSAAWGIVVVLRVRRGEGLLDGPTAPPLPGDRPGTVTYNRYLRWPLAQPASEQCNQLITTQSEQPGDFLRRQSVAHQRIPNRIRPYDEIVDVWGTEPCQPTAASTS